ncbi:MAG: hypothetical protein ACREL7_12500 [Longimicrobiales bacterium]
MGIGSVDIDKSGRILIADPSEGNVKEYSSTGNLITVLERKGGGPGEFGNPRFARYGAGGKVYGVDLESGEISEFGVMREFERRFRPGTVTSIGGFEVLDDFWDAFRTFPFEMGRPW